MYIKVNKTGKLLVLPPIDFEPSCMMIQKITRRRENGKEK